MTMAEPKIRSSCDSCLGSKVKCDQTRPSCSRCAQHGNQCVYSHYRKIGRPSLKNSNKQADRCWHPKNGDVRHNHKAKKQQRLRHSELQASPPACHEHADKKPLLTKSPPFTACMSNDIRPDSAQPLSPCMLPSSTRPSQCPEPTMLSPVSWESALQSGPGLADSDAMAMGHGNDLAALNCTDWEALNDMFNLPDVAITDLPTPLDFDHHDQRGTCLTDLVAFPCSPPTSTKSACITPPSIPLPSYGAPPNDLSNLCLTRPSQVGRPIRPRLRDPHFEELSPTGSVAPSPASSGGCAPGLATPARSSDLTLWSWPTQPSVELNCTQKCHARLNTSIAHMTSYQTDEASLSVDFLLKLEEHVRMERSKVLRCTACMEKTRRGHTLMLITMVAEKIMSLFERERAQDAKLVNDPTFTTNPAMNGRPLYFGHTPKSLSIGDIRIDNAVKSDLLRKLLSLSFQRQLDNVTQLVMMLDGAQDADISSRVTRDLLGDLKKRGSYLLGAQEFATRSQYAFLHSGFDICSSIS